MNKKLFAQVLFGMLIPFLILTGIAASGSILEQGFRQTVIEHSGGFAFVFGLYLVFASIFALFMAENYEAS